MNTENLDYNSVNKQKKFTLCWHRSSLVKWLSICYCLLMSQERVGLSDCEYSEEHSVRDTEGPRLRTLPGELEELFLVLLFSWMHSSAGNLKCFVQLSFNCHSPAGWGGTELSPRFMNEEAGEASLIQGRSGGFGREIRKCFSRSWCLWCVAEPLALAGQPPKLGCPGGTPAFTRMLT